MKRMKDGAVHFGEEVVLSVLLNFAFQQRQRDGLFFVRS